MPRERCLLARPVARVDGLGLARDRSCGRLDSSRPGRGRQPDHITSDAGYLSRSALAELGRAARPYAAMVQRGRPQSALPSSNGERYSHQASPPRIASPPVAVFFPPREKAWLGGCFFHFKPFLCELFVAARPFVARALQSNSFPDLASSREGKTNYSKRWITRLVCR